MSRKPVRILAATIALVAATQSTGAGPDRHAELLPDSVVAFIAIDDPGSLLSSVLNHPLRASLESLPPIESWTQTDDYQQFMSLRAIIERRLGGALQPAVESLAANGIVAAVDSRTEGLVLLGRTDSPALVAKARKTLLELVTEDAGRRGRPTPVESRDYRGLTVTRVGDARFASFDDWWLITNQKRLGKQIVDGYLDGGLQNSLADKRTFQAASQNRPADALAWAFIDVKTIRDAGLATELLGNRAAEFGGELVAGGILTALANAPHLTAALTSEDSQVSLSLKCPFSSEWVDPPRQHFFARNGHRYPHSLQLSSEIASIRVHRDLGHLWNHAADLFDDENVLADLAKAESDLSTLLGGRHFGDEVLGALGPDFYIVAADTSGPQKTPAKGVHLPGFAIVGQLKNPQDSQRLFQVAFQSVVSFANFDSANKGYPPLELDILREDGAKLITAEYIENPGQSVNGSDRVANDFRSNLSPTLGFLQDYIFLSSTRSLARELTHSLQRGDDNVRGSGSLRSEPAANTEIQIRGARLAAILKRNRDHLVAQNMLEKGHDEEHAAAEIRTFLRLVTLLDQASLRLETNPESLTLKATIRYETE